MLSPLVTTGHHPFTRYVFNLSQHSAAISALTQLQEQEVFNVNVVLYIIWFASAQHGRLQKNHLVTLHMAVYLWHERVIAALKMPLMLIDNKTHSKIATLKKLLNIEMDYAQKVEQQLLADTVILNKKIRRHESQQLTDACFNILNYFKLVSIRLTQDNKQAIIELLQATFPQIHPNEIERIFTLTLDTSKFNERTAQLRLENI